MPIKSQMVLGLGIEGTVGTIQCFFLILKVAYKVLYLVDGQSVKSWVKQKFCSFKTIGETVTAITDESAQWSHKTHSRYSLCTRTCLDFAHCTHTYLSNVVHKPNTTAESSMCLQWTECSMMDWDDAIIITYICIWILCQRPLNVYTLFSIQHCLIWVMYGSCIYCTCVANLISVQQKSEVLDWIALMSLAWVTKNRIRHTKNSLLENVNNVPFVQQISDSALFYFWMCVFKLVSLHLDFGALLWAPLNHQTHTVNKRVIIQSTCFTCMLQIIYVQFTKDLFFYVQINDSFWRLAGSLGTVPWAMFSLVMCYKHFKNRTRFVNLLPLVKNSLHCYCCAKL